VLYIQLYWALCLPIKLKTYYKAELMNILIHWGKLVHSEVSSINILKNKRSNFAWRGQCNVEI